MNKKLNRMARRLADHKRKGFTLVELVVVILIIAILAAAIFLGGATVIGQARERQVQSDLKNMASYVEDMLYSNPDLQYFEGSGTDDGACYGTQEYFTFDPATQTWTFGTNVADAGHGAPTATADAADLSGFVGPVWEKLTGNYLTADFQLGDVKDAWDNPYCYSYQMSPSETSGDPSSCVIVINSLGENSLDESSDGNAEAAQKVAAEIIGDLGATGYESATEALATAAIDTKDDYGVVIVMIDGAVSTAYYGF